MVPTHSSCATCGEHIGLLKIILASIGSLKTWSVDCPSCKNRNYIHLLAFLIISPIAALVAIVAGIIGIGSGKFEWVFIAISVLVIHPLILGVFIYSWLRIGSFRSTIV